MSKRKNSRHPLKAKDSGYILTYGQSSSSESQYVLILQQIWPNETWVYLPPVWRALTNSAEDVAYMEEVADLTDFETRLFYNRMAEKVVCTVPRYKWSKSNE